VLSRLILISDVRRSGRGAQISGQEHAEVKRIVAGLVLGSTAHKVIHLADRPVLVVR
jgi:nucleotide-binding universal stress UspA family protein